MYHASLKEQQEVQAYVQNKPLIKPKTNIITILLIIFCYGGFSYLTAFGSVSLFHIKFRIPLVYIASFSISFLYIARLLCIKLVECYQHYAKEETRRKCLCKPTCSEYAIIVLRKDILLVALFKIAKRLFKTCKGGIYKKDEP